MGYNTLRMFEELANVQWMGTDALEGSPRFDYDFHLFIHSTNTEGVPTMVPDSAVGSADPAVNEKPKSFLSQSFS